MSQTSNPAFTVFMQAIDTGNLPGLGPEVRSSAQPSAALGQAVGALGLSGESADLAKAAALLWHDHLDESHTVSQDIGSADGSFLHGIMHRREPDPGNAAYWFRRVGDHPLFSTLGDRVQKHAMQMELPDEVQWLAHCTYWKPQQFIEACESARHHSNEAVCHVLRQVAAIEWHALFEHCQNLARGNHP